MDTVLVTGAGGVIGAWTCRALRRRGVRIVGLDVVPGRSGAVPESDPELAVSGDVRDTALLAELLDREGVTRIVHLAAMIGEAAERDPARAIEVNALATARLLEAARDAGVHRVVAMSTKGVLGPLAGRFLHPRYEPVPVDLPPSPRSIYETTKLIVERLVAAARATGTDATAVRLATTWGPGKSAATHAGFSLHSDVVAAAIDRRSSQVDVHPDQGYDLIYYADVGAGLAAAALATGRLSSPVYHLGSGRIVTMAAFAAAVENAFPGVTVTLGDRFPGGRNCLLDIAAATADFGYRPAYDLAAALADVRELAAVS